MRKKRRVNIHFSKKKVIRICIVVPLMCCALSFCIHNYADAFGGLCYCFHCRLNRVGHRVIEADKKIETAEVATLVNEFRTLYNDFWDTGSVPMDGLSHMSRYDGLHSLSFQDTDSLTRRIGNHYDSLAHGSSDIQSSPETGADVYTQATQGNTLDDVPAQGLYPYLTDMDFPATQRDMVAAYYNQTKVTGKGDIRGENVGDIIISGKYRSRAGADNTKCAKKHHTYTKYGFPFYKIISRYIFFYVFTHLKVSSSCINIILKIFTS
jgi:hypothetical protein